MTSGVGMPSVDLREFKFRSWMLCLSSTEAVYVKACTFLYSFHFLHRVDSVECETNISMHKYRNSIQ